MAMISILNGLTACNNAARDARTVWDSSPAQEIYHSGKFKGYVHLYTIDWLENTSSCSDNTYRIYENSDGEYIINYEGTDYVLRRADEPFENGYNTLKWQMDYNHYIEDIPSSY